MARDKKTNVDASVCCVWLTLWLRHENFKKDHTEWNPDANVREQLGYVYMESNHSHNDSISESSNIPQKEHIFLASTLPKKFCKSSCILEILPKYIAVGEWCYFCGIPKPCTLDILNLSAGFAARWSPPKWKSWGWKCRNIHTFHLPPPRHTRNLHAEWWICRSTHGTTTCTMRT